MLHIALKFTFCLETRIQQKTHTGAVFLHMQEYFMHKYCSPPLRLRIYVLLRLIYHAKFLL